jgi:hypothetical protein
MPPAGFEHAIPESERPQTHALGHTATGIGRLQIYALIYVVSQHKYSTCHKRLLRVAVRCVFNTKQRKLSFSQSTQFLFAGKQNSFCSQYIEIHCNGMETSCFLVNKFLFFTINRSYPPLHTNAVSNTLYSKIHHTTNAYILPV